jgi:hypothetical protein
MIIAVNTVGNKTYYLNFDLIVEFNFQHSIDKKYFIFNYTHGDDSSDQFVISEEEKNKILNKLGL